jgi:hypothetical protein
MPDIYERRAHDRLEALADSLPPRSEARAIVEKTLENPLKAALAALMIATQMGANEEWDSAADYLEYIADELGYTAFPHPGADSTTDSYRLIADGLGIEHDGEDEDEED